MQGSPLPSDAYRLGSLVVVPSLNRFVRGGRTTDVEPRVMAVLTALAEAPCEVVSRAELFETVWADAVVNDEALTRAVSELRKALGPDARGAVETIRGRGYRLAAFPEVLETGQPVLGAPAAESREAVGGGSSARRRVRRGSVLAALALALAAGSLAVSLRGAPVREADPVSAESTRPADEPFRLDPTSQYHRPGMSELGVYYDSSTARYFRFVSDSD